MKMIKMMCTSHLFVVVVLLLSITGCMPEVSEQKGLEPVFFPPPPNQPRLQFLTSYSGEEVTSAVKQSFLEAYVLGDTSNALKGSIVQPYGLAIYQGKIYVCDVAQNNIKVIDIANHTFTIFPGGRSLLSPINIFIEPDGTKYIADSKGGCVLVYDANDKLVGFLGKQLRIKPVDLVVEEKLYLTDANNNQVFVLDKRSGELLQTLGKSMTAGEEGGPDEFAMISGLAIDSERNLYVTDKLKGLVTKFAPDGAVLRTYSRPGSLPDCLVRGKGLKLDREKRLWVVDAGPAMAVKVYRNSDGRFLMIFGLSGTGPGQMYMPASIAIDYDNIDLFKQYAVEGAKIECLILVTNQYGPNKVSVYGFGTFPEKYSMQGVVREQDVKENDASKDGAQESLPRQ
ncbi:MAG: 6-bladed beta-propeller [Phycisphaerae bacterium]|nr:6-bladed beta-propeller [Phycisphaerae bacterium]